MFNVRDFVGILYRIIIYPKEKISVLIKKLFDNNDSSCIADTKDKTVLIGSLKNPRQLSLCIKNNFYHIPEAIAGDRAKDTEYVAIYQSRNLFGRMSGVEFYGKVENTRLVPRYDIEEIPKYSTDMYYRFDVEKWERLDERIIPEGVGIVCEYTTYDKLKKAKTIKELIK